MIETSLMEVSFILEKRERNTIMNILKGIFKSRDKPVTETIMALDRAIRNKGISNSVYDNRGILVL
jgi:hypothetical protein